MRERLVTAFVGLTVVVVALYGIPRAYFLADLVRDEEQSRVDRTVTLVATILDGRPDVTVSYLDSLTGDDERISVAMPDGKTVSSTDGEAPADGDIDATRDLTSGGSVTVTRGAETVNGEIAKALLPLVVLGILLVLLAGAAGFVIARRMARPFQELATAARGLGTGQLHPDLPSYRVPEARAIGEALTSSGQQLDALLQHERELAVHASHELRTPVTALRLELEDLALWPETPPTVAAALSRSTTELDRLGSAIADLLARARERLVENEIDLDLNGLVADTVKRLGDSGVHVEHLPSGPLVTRLDPRPVAQILELLVARAQVHGVREIEVVARDLGSHHEVRIKVDRSLDTGAAREDEDWMLADDLAVAVGGQLTTRGGESFVLRLPKRPLSGD